MVHVHGDGKEGQKPVVVDKLLMGTDSPFTRRVADYRLPEKFKVPQILSSVPSLPPYSIGECSGLVQEVAPEFC